MTNKILHTYSTVVLSIALLLLIASPSICYGRAFACASMPFNTTNFLETIDNHIISLREENIQKAYYKYTSDQFQEETSIREFKAIVNRHPPLKNNAAIQLSSIQFFEEIGQYTGILTSTSGEQMMIEYELIKSEGGWKILGFRLMNYVCEQKGEPLRKGALTAS